LEKERNHVERYHNAARRTGGLTKENEHRAVPEELDGENATSWGGEDCEFLLDCEDDEQDKGEDETSDNLAATPGVEHTTKSDCEG